MDSPEVYTKYVLTVRMLSLVFGSHVADLVKVGRIFFLQQPLCMQIHLMSSASFGPCRHTLIASRKSIVMSMFGRSVSKFKCRLTTCNGFTESFRK